MKRFCAFLLAAVLTLTTAIPALAAEDRVSAKEAPIYLRVDGKLARHISEETIDDSGMSYNVRLSYLIHQEHYVQLREVAVLMGFSTTPFDVQYDAAANAVNIITGTDYTGDTNLPPVYTKWIDGYTVSAVPSVNPILVNGVSRTVTAYVIDRHNYMRLRDIADLAGFTVTWDQASGTVGLWSGAVNEGVHRATVNGGPEDDHLKLTNARINTTPNYQYPNTCSLYDSGSGTVTVVDASYNSNWSDNYLNYGPVEVSVYDASDFSRVSTKTLPDELPMFGAFLHGERYNYICYGQENPDEDDRLEELRIVKYDQDWNRMGSVSVYGDEEYNQITSPFSHGAAMVEQGDTLILHAGMIRYTSYDGLRHQEGVTMGFDMEHYTQGKGPYGWGTSHSLGADVVAGNGGYVTIDVSDGGRRALTFYRAGTAPYSYPDDDSAAYLLPQPGTGIPGITYGDAAATSTHYVAVVGERDPEYWIDNLADSMFNIVVAAVPMSNVSTHASKTYVVGDYWNDGEKFGFMPTAASLPDGRAIVLWQEYQAYDRNGHVYSDKPLDVKYVVLNTDGSPSDVAGTLSGYSTSTCQPEVVGDQLVWYANLNNTRYFYTVPLSAL